VEGFKASSSSNGSKEGKDKQRLKRSLSDTDLQRNIDRFQHDTLYNLKKPRIEDNPKSIDHAKEQPTSEIEKAIEQRTQAIMDKYFGDITELLAAFEKQGVRLLDTGESSSSANTPLSPQKRSEESTSDVISDESVKTLYKTHTATFKPVFQLAFEQPCQKNQSEGDALFQASAEAHQLAYKHTFLKAKELVLQQEIEKVRRKSQKLNQSIEERLQAAMHSEIKENVLEYIQTISQLPVVKDFSNERPVKYDKSFSNLLAKLQSNSVYRKAIFKVNEILPKYAYYSLITDDKRFMEIEKKLMQKKMQIKGHTYFYSLLLNAMHKEYVYTRLAEQILNTTGSYKDKYGLEYKSVSEREKGADKKEKGDHQASRKDEQRCAMP
jgi:hypothetical protein